MNSNPSALSTEPGIRRALRRLWRLPWFGLHIVFGLPLAVLAQTPGLRDMQLAGSSLEEHLSRWWCRMLFRIFGIRLEIFGALPPALPPGVLVAANHQSWLDIFVLLAVGLMRFVAKAEIGRWPLAGWIVTRSRALYLQRGKSSSTAKVQAAMAALLAAGERLVIFPEGGIPHAPGIQHFHSRLFAPAAAGLCPLLPAAIRFTQHGRVSEIARFRPGEHLLGNFWRLLGESRLKVEVRFLPALAPAGGDRRSLARAAHDAVTAAWSAPVMNLSLNCLTNHSGMAPFRPSRGLTNRHVQSLLSSSAVRRIVLRHRARLLLAASRHEIITTPKGVRLSGWRTPARGAARGLAILLHGWEGSASSNYILSAANVLWQSGFEVFRLNFRDHGASHHLNRELFHSCRLEEVVDAIAMLAGSATVPVTLAGFSLGGNFALRVALAAPGRGIALAQVIAVCPVIRPAAVLDALERGLPIYERYFERKWRRSLKRKQALFPADYDFREWFTMRGLRNQTRYLIEKYTDFPTLDKYLEGYALSGDRLSALKVPTMVIAAADDPVVPVADFAALPRPPAMTLRLEAHGGHCGFLANWRLESWIDRLLVQTAPATDVTVH